MGGDIDLAVVGMIGVLSIIQSIFGIGVLIFGTPILLLVDFPFDQILSTLLPASLTLSLLQLVLDKGLSKSSVGEFVCWMVPPLCVGLMISLTTDVLSLDLFITFALLVIAYLRVSRRYRTALFGFAAKHQRLMLITIGFIHGLTNLGGSLLEAYVSSVHTDKQRIRQNIALGYAMLAGSQLIILVSMGRGNSDATSLAAMATAGIVYLTVGRAAFLALSQQKYRSLVSILIVLAAIALLCKRAIA
ncbi:TSUP family transporter [Achromobacter spanius]|uniref:Probable membrane transporter protein n=1 Tax=Achromobacter spanius TaxID=217203 RepID=A0A2S0I5L8_9BURK|nr:TSUP family transporter [Achromobacter spanius]AVJ27340.1 hypothetical protein CLM73_09580 [Achromobacter spanius]